MRTDLMFKTTSHLPRYFGVYINIYSIVILLFTCCTVKGIRLLITSVPVAEKLSAKVAISYSNPKLFMKIFNDEGQKTKDILD